MLSGLLLEQLKRVCCCTAAKVASSGDCIIMAFQFALDFSGVICFKDIIIKWIGIIRRTLQTCFLARYIVSAVEVFVTCGKVAQVERTTNITKVHRSLFLFCS